MLGYSFSSGRKLKRAMESVRIGVRGLLAHRIRSVLTALGIIFGVAAVIAMLSIGEGARLEALEQIRAFSWEGDPEEFLPVFSPYEPPLEAIVE